MSENIDNHEFCTVMEDEVSLRRHLAELERILDMIPALITVLSPNGKLLYVNKAILRYTGLHMDDLKAGDARMLMFHPEDVERLKDLRHSGLGQGSPFELEMRARWHGGDYRWVSIHYEPLRDENGQILLMCRFHSNSQAQRVCARYQRQKKPRYHYWVTTLAPHGPH